MIYFVQFYRVVYKEDDGYRRSTRWEHVDNPKRLTHILIVFFVHGVIGRFEFVMRKIIILFIIFQILSCEMKSQNDEFPNLIFRENKVLIGPEIDYNGVALSMPIDIEKMDSEDYTMIERYLENVEDSYFDTDVLAVYINKRGMVCIISKIKNEREIFSKLDKVFEENLIQSFGAKETRRGQFSINGLKVVQFITSKTGIINYKLYTNVKKSNCHQIDYFIPAEYYVKFRESMEASIATVRLNH